MRKNLTRLKRSNITVLPTSQAAQKSWVERHAPIATIVAAYSTLLAVIVAGLGYYFTVIPLYQKAAVDELIAKREIELKDAQDAIVVAKRQAYEQQRANFVSAIEFSAVECSDLRTSFRQSAPNSIEDPAARRADHEQRIRLGVEVAPCLTSVLTKYEATTRLSETDVRHIGALFAKLGERLDRQRSEATAQIAEIPSLAARDPSVLAPVGPEVQRNDDFRAEARERLAKIGVSVPALDEQRKGRLQYRIGLTQLQIANDYRHNAAQVIREAVRGLQWPKQAESMPASR